jgi:hypothetical protein
MLPLFDSIDFRFLKRLGPVAVVLADVRADNPPVFSFASLRGRIVVIHEHQAPVIRHDSK